MMVKVNFLLNTEEYCIPLGRRSPSNVNSLESGSISRFIPLLAVNTTETSVGYWRMKLGRTLKHANLQRKCTFPGVSTMPWPKNHLCLPDFFWDPITVKQTWLTNSKTAKKTNSKTAYSHMLSPCIMIHMLEIFKKQWKRCIIVSGYQFTMDKLNDA